MDIFVREEGTRQPGCDETPGWVWFSAGVLETALMTDASEWKGCRVFELGSGTGWLSLRLASKGASVTATDRPGAIPLLTRNVFRNQERLGCCVQPQQQADASCGGNSGSHSHSDKMMELQVDIQPLEWDSDETIPGEWDLFIGSDLLYIPEHHGPLLQTLLRHDCRRCVIAWEERKPLHEAGFLELAREAGFVFDPPTKKATNPATKNGVWLLLMTHPGNSTKSDSTVM